MKQNLKFILALGDMKMVVLDNPARQEVYARQDRPKTQHEESIRRIAEALAVK